MCDNHESEQTAGFTQDERAVAKQAPAALTRLRQGCNPFEEPTKFRQMREDKKTLKNAFVVLSIPEGYGADMLDTLQRISRGLPLRGIHRMGGISQ